MGWREKMGGAIALEHFKTLEQKAQKEQKGYVRGAFAPFAPIALRVGKVKNDSEPDPETQYAIDERAAIIEFDGGQVVPSKEVEKLEPISKW